MIHIFSIIILAVSTNAEWRDIIDTNKINGISLNEKVSIEFYPYQLSVQLDRKHKCGGCLLSKRYALTAAHCITESHDRYTIRMGSSHHDRKGRVYRIKSIHVHENFTENYKSGYKIPVNDIAAIHLQHHFFQHSYQHPIGLFHKGDVARAGTIAEVSGWGIIEQNSSKSTRLRAVKVPIVSKEDCSNAYSSIGGIPEGQICAGQDGKDACVGYSGGPLIIDYLLAGIVSWGWDCGNPRYPGVYTEVAYYRDWIEEKTGC